MEKIIQILDDMISHDFGWNYNGQHNCIEEAKERIIALGNGWIKIEDTLPEPFKEVLVVSNDFPPTIGYYNNRSNSWYLVGREDHIIGLTHWMEIPLHPLNT